MIVVGVVAEDSRSRAGALAARQWLAQRGLSSPIGSRWEVGIALDVAPRQASFAFKETVDTRFHLTIQTDEWSFYFCHGNRASGIRVTEVPIVKGRDDHGLLSRTPPLRDIGTLLRELESRHYVRFQRSHAAVRADITGAEPVVRGWLASI